MFNVQITDSDKNIAQQEATYINKGHSSIGKNGTKQQQIIGNIAENKIVKILNIPKSNEIIDEGFDVKINDKLIDIKCMGRQCEPRLDYVGNFEPRQKNYKANYLLFTSYNKKNSILTICGLIEKIKYFEKAKLFKAGTSRPRFSYSDLILENDLYELEYKYLIQIDNLQDLKNKLYN